MATNSVIDDAKNWFNGLSSNGKLIVVAIGILACWLLVNHIQERNRQKAAEEYAAHMLLRNIASQGSSINTDVSAGDQNMPQPGIW